jgi:hypothetical protein
MMRTPEHMLAEFYIQDRLREEQERQLVKLAMADVPHRPFILFTLLSRLLQHFQRPVNEVQNSPTMISQQASLRKAVL